MRPVQQIDRHDQMQAMLTLLMQNMGQGRCDTIPIQMLRAPQPHPQPAARGIVLETGSSASSSTRAKTATLALGDIQQIVSDDDDAPPPASKMLSVDQTTDLILKSLADRTSRNIAGRKRDASEAAAGDAEKEDKTKAKAKAKAKAKPKGKAGAKAKNASGAVLSVEWSRQQVLARTGKVGPGNNKAFKFKAEKDVPAARRSAMQWLAGQGCTI
jgi:hypothetical protein